MQSSAYVLGKLYSNTLLVVFNNRIFLARARRNPNHETNVFEVQTSSVPSLGQTIPDTPTKFVVDIHAETGVEYRDDIELGERVCIDDSKRWRDNY